MKQRIFDILFTAALFMVLPVSCAKDEPAGKDGRNWAAPALTFVTEVSSCPDAVRSSGEADSEEVFEGTDFLTDSKGNTVLMGCYRTESDNADSPASKAKLINTSGSAQLYAGGFNVIAWTDDDGKPFIKEEYVAVSYDSGTGTWQFSSKDNETLWGDKRSRTFFAYANDDDDDDVHTFICTKDSQIMTYIVPDTYSAQTDVVMAAWRGTTVPQGGNIPTGEVNLTFRHPLAAVSFTLGAIEGVESITKVTIDGVYSKGTVTQDYTGAFSWNTSDAENKIITIGNGSDPAIKTTVNDDYADHLLLIPQDFSAKPVTITLTVTKTGGGTDTMLAFLKSGKWEAGKHYKYKIGDNLPVVSVNDDYSIKNESTFGVYVQATVTGNWYNSDGQIVAPWTPAFSTETGWSGPSSDGVYSYGSLLGSGQSTTPLMPGFTKPTDGPADATFKFIIHTRACGEPF